MRMIDRCSGFPPRVEDGLAVAETRDGRVFFDPVADGGHHQVGVVVAQHRPFLVVVGREDQHLMDTTGRGLDEYRSAVGDHEGPIAFEGRIEIGDDPHQPMTLWTVRLQGRRGGLLVAGTEWAGPGRVRLGGGHRRERHGPIGPVGTHHYPTAGERIEAELVHLLWWCPMRFAIGIEAVVVEATQVISAGCRWFMSGNSWCSPPTYQRSNARGPGGVRCALGDGWWHGWGHSWCCLLYTSDAADDLTR